MLRSNAKNTASSSIYNQAQLSSTHNTNKSDSSPNYLASWKNLVFSWVLVNLNTASTVNVQLALQAWCWFMALAGTAITG